MNSTILRGGTIIDGTGGKPFRGDVWIEGDLIRAVGEVEKGIVGKELDVTGLSVAPGFIDLHTHTDRKIFDNPMGDSKIMQGVTTDVTSNCGVGPFPANPCRIAELESYLNTLSGSLPKGGVSWTDFHGFADAVEKVGPGMNLVMLAAQGAVRIAGVGWDDRPPTETELTQMQAMLDESLQQGAWGMSSGLIYPPGSFAQADELTALAKVLAKQPGAICQSYPGRKRDLMDSIEEAIALGQKVAQEFKFLILKQLANRFGARDWQRCEGSNRPGPTASTSGRINILTRLRLHLWLRWSPAGPRMAESAHYSGVSKTAI